MSLQDPNKKMSKSDPVIDSYIALLDDPDTIRRKVKRAVTDSGKSICQSVEKPGISNLLMLLSILTQQSIPNLESYYQGKNYGTLKSDLTEALIACCRPIQEAFYDLRKDASYLQTVLKDGAEKANNQASQKLAEVQQAIGFIMPAQAK